MKSERFFREGSGKAVLTALLDWLKPIFLGIFSIKRMDPLRIIVIPIGRSFSNVAVFICKNFGGVSETYVSSTFITDIVL